MREKTTIDGRHQYTKRTKEKIRRAALEAAQADHLSTAVRCATMFL